MKKLLQLFMVFFKAGSFTFAGGLAMIPLIQKDVVEKYKFIDEEEFIEYVALAQTLPGVIALNTAVFVGRRTKGMIGAIAAGLGAIVPAFVTMLLATILVQSIPRDSAYVQGFFKGITASSAALILGSAISLGKNVSKGSFAISLSLIAFALIIFFNVGSFPVVIAAGVAGIVYQSVRNKKIKNVSETNIEETDTSDATIDAGNEGNFNEDVEITEDNEDEPADSEKNTGNDNEGSI